MSVASISTKTETEERKPDIYFSQSRLNLAIGCLGKYYFRYIKEISTPSIIWPATLFGKVNHKVTEDFIAELRAGGFKKEINKINANKDSAQLRKYFIDSFQKEYQRYFEEVNDKSNTKEQFRKSRDFNKTNDLKNGSKWSAKVHEFLIKYTDMNEHSVTEQKVTHFVETENNKLIKTTAYMDFIPSPEKHFIYDFKNTKKPEKYYFVDWDNDLQSLIYLFLYYKEFRVFPKRFGYLVFSFQESMILVNDNQTSEDDLPVVKEKYYKALSRLEKAHEICVDPALWICSPQKCKWCEFNKKKFCEKGFNFLKKSKNK